MEPASLGTLWLACGFGSTTSVLSTIYTYVTRQSKVLKEQRGDLVSGELLAGGAPPSASGREA